MKLIDLYMQTMSLMMRAFDTVVATRARVRAFESAIQVKVLLNLVQHWFFICLGFGYFNKTILAVLLINVCMCRTLWTWSIL